MKIRPLTVAPLLLCLSIIVAIGQQQETVSKKLILHSDEHPSFGEAEFNLDYFKKYELNTL